MLINLGFCLDILSYNIHVNLFFPQLINLKVKEKQQLLVGDTFTNQY